MDKIKKRIIMILGLLLLCMCILGIMDLYYKLNVPQSPDLDDMGCAEIIEKMVVGDAYCSSSGVWSSESINIWCWGIWQDCDDLMLLLMEKDCIGYAMRSEK